MLERMMPVLFIAGIIALAVVANLPQVWQDRAMSCVIGAIIVILVEGLILAANPPQF